MSRLFLFAAALTLFAGGAPVLPAAASAPMPMAACLSEAQWPVTHSPAFADGSARTREMLLNGIHADVTRYTGLCRQIAAAPAEGRAAANTQCQQDAADDKTATTEAARAHLARMAARCAALAG